MILQPCFKVTKPEFVYILELKFGKKINLLKVLQTIRNTFHHDIHTHCLILREFTIIKENL